ncbi:Com family DNA-binding transcriptional regulator [Clostridium botulinum]|uniref:Com family DNA-binding transcriptional regulator n=1 Tax=Clostridium botulinum TaxID=1491 RepID=A0A846JA49_CLOBO|nr:Com family DNA-binding transcriptional regulator [Clostridium botulinum]NFJ08723.1 Com family DNA-binding transcriptional regulator [Clostridium botulinum]NFK15119.1 Com family DNA-binding transcriptional regulator [Clostridium botulinum]NFM93079.1 Com family DNA-binding transcriptional regulator [Clostridium botulinum]NFO18726.1 Com family DNA-binding transcriptional regulator [Clostridium botulinum]
MSAFLNGVINIEEVRCPNCNQMLLKADYIKGEIKCIRCKKIIELEINQRTEPNHTIE